MQRLKYHRGSIYCTAWSEDGRVIATGSNDTAVHLLYVDPETGAPTATTPEGSFIQLTHHDGTVRDVAFMVSVKVKRKLLGLGICIYCKDIWRTIHLAWSARVRCPSGFKECSISSKLPSFSSFKLIR